LTWIDYPFEPPEKPVQFIRTAPLVPADQARVAHVNARQARFREVLDLLGDGASNQQIARSLGVSLITVQNHVSRILDKLQATDRTQAALRARGLSAPPPLRARQAPRLQATRSLTRAGHTFPPAMGAHAGSAGVTQRDMSESLLPGLRAAG
jgi:DNA-binding CsgD family transcriptional regulator